MAPLADRAHSGGQHALPLPLAARPADTPDVRDRAAAARHARSVARWYATTALDTPTLRSHAYGLLRTILGQALRDELIRTNPCHVRGAGNAKRAKKIKPATLAELKAIVTAMPARYRVMVLLASWFGMRFAELRRGDVNTKAGIVHIRRGVVRAGGETIVKKPKSDAGVRDVAIPPHLLPLIRQHLLEHAEPGKHGLCSRRAEADAWRRRASIACSTGRGRTLGARTSAGTT